MPKWKTDALSQCKMGIFCKIFINFGEKFWGTKKHFFIASEKKGFYPFWTPLKENSVICVVTGEEAARVERLSKEEVMDEIH